ncbi:hypothetical protein [Bacillus seohaeanensis]|uniref:YesK-like protein n=1 Tax=Bacillus seohaeanensis TaxID=284580 RepID=A0ABW5RUZ2_9BACI
MLDDSNLNIIVGFILPMLLIVGSVYWTIKISYSKRFIPAIMLILLAIFVFLLPLIFASFDVMEGDFGIAITSIYFSIALLFGSLVNLIVIFTLKRSRT